MLCYSSHNAMLVLGIPEIKLKSFFFNLLFFLILVYEIHVMFYTFIFNIKWEGKGINDLHVRLGGFRGQTYIFITPNYMYRYQLYIFV